MAERQRASVPAASVLPVTVRRLFGSGLCSAAMCAASPLAAQESTAEDWIRNPAMGNYKAYAEFKMAKYDSARLIWQVLADRGNADALFNLGTLAEDGLGEAVNMNKAEALYTAAANAGSFKAQYRLGMLYAAGVVLQKDLHKARRYLGLAAEAGDKEAAARLGLLERPDRPATPFEQAELLSSSGQHEGAARIYAGLARQGHVTAQTRLAWMHEAGRGVARDLAEAARLFTLSAQAGDAEAQYAIAVMHRTGRGKEKDDARSEFWLRKAAAQNYPAAIEALAGQSLVE